MTCRCWNAFFAVLILVFSFWQTGFSKLVIIIAAAFILIKAILDLFRDGCSVCCSSVDKTGSEVFVEKSPKSDMPSKKEVEETLVKSKKKPVSKKKK